MCREAREKSWCSWSRVRCRDINACLELCQFLTGTGATNPYFPLLGIQLYPLSISKPAWCFFASTIIKPAQMPLTSPVRCPGSKGRIAGCNTKLSRSPFSFVAETKSPQWW